ncbi:hypothetical protein ACFFRR_011462 [Megaselia abdita]
MLLINLFFLIFKNIADQTLFYKVSECLTDEPKKQNYNVSIAEKIGRFPDYLITKPAEYCRAYCNCLKLPIKFYEQLEINNNPIRISDIKRVLPITMLPVSFKRIPQPSILNKNLIRKAKSM